MEVFFFVELVYSSKLPNIIIDFFIFPFISISFCFTYLAALLLYAYTLKIALSFW